MKETQARLIEEFSTICRDYCDISWGKALDVARVPVGSDLRRPESIYYDPEIRANSQVLTPLTPNRPHMHLSS